MPDRNCFVILQNRTDSEYNDFLGKFYHFPKKYYNQLSKPNVEFVYYEPSSTGEGVYFGYGKIKNVFADKRQEDHFFAEIEGYKPFSTPLPFKTDAGQRRETGAGYNQQNSVREISPELLEELCLDGGIILNFTTDAHLMRILGEQLIATEQVGVLELIKNSYDARALKCRVRIENIPNLNTPQGEKSEFPDLPGPVIIIEDDGVGMDKHIVEFGWLRPASPLKTNIKDKIKAVLATEKEHAAANGEYKTYTALVETLKKAHGGRIPLGEKGVGRFATHKLGSKLLLTTKTKGATHELVLRIDWDIFDSVSETGYKDLESIGISLNRQALSRDYGPNDSGTRIVIYGGRSGYALKDETVREIGRTILSLQSPNKAPGNFNIKFECPQVELSDNKIVEGFSPVFAFDGTVDEGGLLDYTLQFSPDKSVPMPKESIEGKGIDLRKDEKYWKSGDGVRRPACGLFFVNLKIWYRTSPWVDMKRPDAKQFLGHLDKFGGISIYRDGINIFPAEWGSEVDWLKITTRHIKKGSRISYYNMIGHVETDQAINLNLIDKTDREGLLKNIAFNDMAELMRSIIFLIENHFAGKRDAYELLKPNVVRDSKTLSAISRDAGQLAESIERGYDFTVNPLKIFEDVSSAAVRKQKVVNLRTSLKNLQKSIDAINEVNETLSENASYGLAVASSLHELAKITSNFYNGITYLLKSNTFDVNRLEDLKMASQSLKSELQRLGPMRAVKNESPMEFDINRIVDFCIGSFKPQFEKEKISFELEQEGSFSVFCRFGVLAQVLSNLLDNSIYWMRIAGGEKKIRIRIDAPTRTVVIADSGTGIDETMYPYLFEPGYSLKVPPSGLGLYLCKYFMTSMQGIIRLSAPKEQLSGFKGAQFTLDFTKVKP